MVIRRLMEEWLGPWSVELLNFYSANSLVVNVVVLTYGLVLMVSWFNLSAIRRRLLSDIVDEVKRRSDGGGRSVQGQILTETEVHWERAVSQARFPLIAEQWSFRLRPASVESVQAVLSRDILIRDAMNLLSNDNSAPDR